ncbi:protein ZGRF1-like [Lingula anatina]|uniref:Protein ZGRF1-like n=1 Tax=Lingula anatina TaxID=7574 RepID=A0A1S3HNJ9_LINAN|nr:protein ZGRF1-like [Lingula anatina]|eukprot:XP_013386609.1 protein ZGRF1-like [Lingula anatina]
MSGLRDLDHSTKASCHSKDRESTNAHQIKATSKGESRFPSKQEIGDADMARRLARIPVKFATVQQYTELFETAQTEDINILLNRVSKTYHQALERMAKHSDGKKGLVKRTTYKPQSLNPLCHHGVTSKIEVVKKDGKNKGRNFFVCNLPLKQQCEFFLWSDVYRTACRLLTVDDADSSESLCKSYGVDFFSECEFGTRRIKNWRIYQKGFPKWVRRGYLEDEKLTERKLYLQLRKWNYSSNFAKGDLWMISKTMDFSPESTFLAYSVFHGVGSTGELEIEPLRGCFLSDWEDETLCYAIRGANFKNEIACLYNLQKNVCPQKVPILPHLLSRDADSMDNRKKQNRSFLLTRREVEEYAAFYIKKYGLNTDQAEALMSVSNLFTGGGHVHLIHGAFGSGKSSTVAVIIEFLVQLFKESDRRSVQQGWKILISSATNVAVDRVLEGLLEHGFKDFVRVGSAPEISKRVLPYSVRATGRRKGELRKLERMLKRAKKPSEKQYLKEAIQKHGINRRKLLFARVVGATCATCGESSLMKGMIFPILILDEASQLTEPAALIPMKFGCEKSLMVGDTKQLNPIIQGSAASNENGLEQTMFDRLMAMGHELTTLRTQYRCHPRISAMASTLFYGGLLKDGVSEKDREPLMKSCPPLCFIDVSKGQEAWNRLGSIYNKEEAAFVASLLKKLLSEGLKPAQIGVITPFRSQVAKINKEILLASSVNEPSKISAVQISTVDAFQGGEKDVIILSFVKTNNTAFIDCKKRTNVALTRAKHHLLLVGQKQNLERNPMFKEVIFYCGSDVVNASQFMRTFQQQKTSEAEKSPSQKQGFSSCGMQQSGHTDSSKSLILKAEQQSPSNVYSENITDKGPQGTFLPVVQAWCDTHSPGDGAFKEPPCHVPMRSLTRPRIIDENILSDSDTESSDNEDLPAF